MICMKWLSESEICIFAQHSLDSETLNDIMSPYGNKTVIITKGGLQVLDDTAGKREKE